MKTGNIILIPFPFAELTTTKARPAVIVTVTKDRYQDIVIAAISSIISPTMTDNEMVIKPSDSNRLKVTSVIKVDRLATVKQKDIIAPLGELSPIELQSFQVIFKKLVD